MSKEPTYYVCQEVYPSDMLINIEAAEQKVLFCPKCFENTVSIFQLFGTTSPVLDKVFGLTVKPSIVEKKLDRANEISEFLIDSMRQINEILTERETEGILYDFLYDIRDIVEKADDSVGGEIFHGTRSNL